MLSPTVAVVFTLVMRHPGLHPGHPVRIRASIRAIRTGSGPDPVRAAIRPDPGMLLTDPVRIRGHPDRIRSGSGAHPIDNWGAFDLRSPQNCVFCVGGDTLFSCFQSDFAYLMSVYDA